MKSENDSILSPVTYTDNVSYIRSFETRYLRQQYIKETSVSVDKYFQNLDVIQLYQCNDTGYRFYYPFNIFGDGEFYNQLNANNKWYYQNERWEHQLAASIIRSTDNVLEVGAGDGWFMKKLLRQGVSDLYGLEFNSAAIEKMKKEGFKIFSETIQSYAVDHPAEHDVVCCFQVLEHIQDVKSFLDAEIKTLKKGGRLIMSVPNNNPYLFKYDDYNTLNLPPHHAGLWNVSAFEKLPGFFPLKLIKTTTEPLTEYKHWYTTQKKHLKNKEPFKAFLHSMVPHFIYYPYLKSIRNKIEGRNIMVVFEKID